MPFTIAHPIIILPFTRLARLSSTALIVGSIVPDFEFFFQLKEVKNIGHSWYGVLLLDLPLAILLCYLFHNLVRNLFLSHVPAFLYNKFSFVTHFNWNAYAVVNKLKVMLSVMIGVASHLVWDGFTHNDGMFVKIIPGLLINTGWSFFDFPVYHFLQLLFSVVGLLIMIFVVYILPQNKKSITKSYSVWYWPLLIGLISIIFIIRVVQWPQYNTFGGLAIATMGSITYGVLVTSIIFKYFLFKKIML